MGQINKGKIASVSENGKEARVIPSNASAKPTAKITIPWHLRGSAGNLKKGTEVVYAEFEDSTGLLIGRADGEWEASLPMLVVENFDARAISAVSAEIDSLKAEKAEAETLKAENAEADTLKAEKVEVETVEATSDVTVEGISLKTHTHGGVENGGGMTSEPQ